MIKTSTIATHNKTALLNLMNDYFYQIAMHNRKRVPQEYDLIMDFYNFIRQHIAEQQVGAQPAKLRLKTVLPNKKDRILFFNYCLSTFFHRPVSDVVRAQYNNLQETGLVLYPLKDVMEVKLVSSKDFTIRLKKLENNLLGIETCYKKLTNGQCILEPVDIAGYLLNLRSLQISFDEESVSFLFVEEEVVDTVEGKGFLMNNLGDVLLTDIDAFTSHEKLPDMKRIQLLWHLFNYPAVVEKIIRAEDFPDIDL